MQSLDKSIVGVILAGGQSRRMGGDDKGLMDFGGGTLMGNAIRKLQPQVAEVIINANGDPSRFSQFAVPVVADSVSGFVGPLGGVLAGMRWAASQRPGARFVATAACDTPFFPDDLVQRLGSALAGRERGVAIAASGGDTHQVFGLWSIALADDLEEALNAGHRKVLDWARRHDAFEVNFERLEIAGRTIDPFLNANTPDELLEANRLLAQSLQ